MLCFVVASAQAVHVVAPLRVGCGVVQVCAHVARHGMILALVHDTVRNGMPPTHSHGRAGTRVGEKRGDNRREDNQREAEISRVNQNGRNKKEHDRKT